jgi:signal transduction histidine kinase
VIVRPRVPLGQKILGALIAIDLLALGGSTIFISQSAVNQVKLLTSAKRPAKSFSLAESEALIYVIRLEQWSFGLKERRDVQNARTVLSRRLSGIDSFGNSPGRLASLEYLSTLNESDAILQSTVPGLLPTELQKSVQVKLGPITEQIILQSKALVDTFQRQQDFKIRKSGNSRNALQRVTLFLLFIFLVMFTAFVVWNGKSTSAYFRRSQADIQRETEKLDGLIEELSLSVSVIANLRELSESKTAFVASVNHELRTPLSSIIGYVELIRGVTDNRPELGILKYLEIVDRNANILLGLVDGILSLAKLDSNKAPLPNVRVDIDQVIGTAISVLEPVCRKSNIDIKLSINKDVSYSIQGDAGQLNQVFLNLLSNSIKFSDANSPIEIEVDNLDYEEAFSFVRIIIRDHGIGIPARDIDRLFMRFYRANNAVGKQFSGTGLGLAIVEQIVQYHGGNVRVESVEGEGTTIILEFPKYLSQAEKMVMDRRFGVLSRAIATLEGSSKRDLHRVTHEIGGSIGFYTFEEESRLILDFSNWLNSGIHIYPIEVESRRQAILVILRSRLASLLERELHE